MSSVKAQPNWLRVEQCALSLNVVDNTSYARQQVRDLKLMPAREIIVIRGGRSHDTSFGLPTSLLLAPRPSFVFITVNSFFINITNTFKIMPLSLHLHQRQ